MSDNKNDNKEVDELKEFEKDVEALQNELNVDDIKNSDLMNTMTTKMLNPELSQDEYNANLKAINYAFAIMDEDKNGEYAEFIEKIRLKEKEEFDRLNEIKERNEEQNNRYLELSQAGTLEPFEYFTVNLFNKDKIEAFKVANPDKLELFNNVDNKIEKRANELEEKYGKDNPHRTKKDFESLGALDTVLDTLNNPKLKNAIKIGRMVAMPHTIPMMIASKAIGGLICAGLKTEAGQNLIGKMKESWENKFGPIKSNPDSKLTKSISALLTVGAIVGVCAGVDLDVDDVKNAFSNTFDAVSESFDNIDYEKILHDGATLAEKGLNATVRTIADGSIVVDQAIDKGLDLAEEGLDSAKEIYANKDQIMNDVANNINANWEAAEDVVQDKLKAAGSAYDNVENYVDEKVANLRDQIVPENYEPGQNNTYAATSGQNMGVNTGGDTTTLAADSADGVSSNSATDDLDAEVKSAEPVKLGDEIKTNFSVNQFTDPPTMEGTITLNGKEINVNNLTPEMQDKLFVSMEEKSEFSGNQVDKLREQMAFRREEHDELRSLLEQDGNLEKLLNGENLNNPSVTEPEVKAPETPEVAKADEPKLDAEAQRAAHNMEKAEAAGGDKITTDEPKEMAAENSAETFEMPDQFKIKDGDNLETLVKNAMPEGTKYEDIQEMTRKIAEFNGMADADKIFPDQVIKIPEMDQLDDIKLKDFAVDGPEDLFALDKVPYGSQMTPDEFKDQVGGVLKDIYPNEPDRVHEMMAYVNQRMGQLDPSQPIPSGTDIGLGDEYVAILRDKTYGMSDELSSQYHGVEDPKVEEPKVQEPKVQEPKVEEPKVEEPKVEEPKVQEPKVEEPKVEEPKVEEPKVEEPKVQEPKVEEPKVQEPKVEEPKVEEPKVEEPKVEEPKVEEPKVEEPKVEEPKVQDPDSLAAETDFDVKPSVSDGIVPEAPNGGVIPNAPDGGIIPEAPDTDVPEYQNPNSGRAHFEDISQEEKDALLNETTFDEPEAPEVTQQENNFDAPEPVKLDDSISSNFSVSQLTDVPKMEGTVTLNGQEINVNNLTPELQDKLFVSMEEKRGLDGITNFEKQIAAVEFGHQEMMEFREHFENNPDDLAKLLAGGNLNTPDAPILEAEDLSMQENSFETNAPDEPEVTQQENNFEASEPSVTDDVSLLQERIAEMNYNYTEIEQEAIVAAGYNMGNNAAMDVSDASKVFDIVNQEYTDYINENNIDPRAHTLGDFAREYNDNIGVEFDDVPNYLSSAVKSELPSYGDLTPEEANKFMVKAMEMIEDGGNMVQVSSTEEAFEYIKTTFTDGARFRGDFETGGQGEKFESFKDAILSDVSSKDVDNLPQYLLHEDTYADSKELDDLSNDINKDLENKNQNNDLKNRNNGLKMS